MRTSLTSGLSGRDMVRCTTTFRSGGDTLLSFDAVMDVGRNKKDRGDSGPPHL